MKNIQLVALDVDGTLLNSKNIITENTLAALKEAKSKGIQIVLATGRPLKGILPQLKQLGIFSPKDYVITINGAVISTIDGTETLRKETLSKEECEEVIAEAEKLKASFQLVSGENIYTIENPISRYTLFDANLTGMPLYAFDDLSSVLKHTEVIKIMMLDGKKALTEKISLLPKDLNQRYTMLRTLDYYYEFLKKGVSKGSGLEVLANHLGIKKSHVVAMGDNENDISMITYAGLGVAMGNSEKVVQQYADFVTTSNDEDGVAKVFEKFIL